jgi:hypothetical protein
MEIGLRSRSAGYHTRDDFLDVCEWKTRGRPRTAIARKSRFEARAEFIFAAGIPLRRANLHPSCQD